MTTQVLTDAMGQRVAVWLRHRYPREGAKRIARDMAASPHTARRWLEGALPENRHLVEMGRRWGSRFIAFVFEPVIGPAAGLALDDELQELRERFTKLEAEFAQARSVRGTARPRDAVDLPAYREVGSGPGRAVAGPLAPLDGGER
ncbi:MAG: hypothetical protein AB7P02_15750 [Alphaproteobacteria bacterium]